MVTSSTFSPRAQLGKTVRERYLADVSKAMVEIGTVVQSHLTELVIEPAMARESQLRRDTWTAYKSAQNVWVDLTLKVWRDCLGPQREAKSSASMELGGMELVGTEVVENKILASRMVLAVNEKVISELDDVRVRLKYLEKIEDLDNRDLMRPEVLVLLLVEQWPKSGMSPDAWSMVSPVVQRVLIERMKLAYKEANELLVQNGILPVIELKDRVRAPRSIPGGFRPAPRPESPPTGSGQLPTDQQGTESGSAAQRAAGGFFGGRLGWRSGAPSAPASMPGAQSAPNTGSGSTGSTPFWKSSGASGGSERGQAYSAAEETRMLTAGTPLARARSRAQGVIGQLKRIFSSNVGSDFAGTQHYQPSPALAHAISPQVVAARYAEGGTLYEDFSPAGVVRVANDLRQKSTELKQKAETKGEKATIEIVALMFQAILAEERIPPGIRVWFARLQMPVLRVALEDADFFGTADHPARLLIDRMGSCVMGFDGTDVQSGAMETEVKRIVQVIEQYPETGKKVYQIVYEEFQKFLSKFLTEKGSTQKVVSVAQQVEQKETLAIQYTIEMRNMLQDMPVRDEIRDFLFKVWAEVLAVSALRKGSKHADTQSLKKCATDLVWAASAKPSRADRARVIQDLPNLLLRLRSGMTLLAMAPSEQEGHVKAISDTLADAFMSKTQAIPQEKIDAMAQRLSNLEDFVSDDIMGDLPLDAESLEMMLGIDASAIEVVSGGGSKPTAAMLAWAAELQLGAWFSLDHNSQITQVQFAWRSERKHLNLFASTNGRTFLIQGGRLAAYLQAGLLLPQEEEALTVRATRDALAKIEANPERLLV
ncbi:DUF1631 domain-containing protein [Rhodoferax lacus]|uniref:DUF1631 domain-containing protein n=1 Tax=Rhodoferax lacus TaxID=2184758 RepID=A0A3E1RB28_9BURK|nr:DUF1631 family protein [Rhodoferax lacus]RFO96574.1 DUF1631 domain-containing protein [Rhodoferax lacus]